MAAGALSTLLVTAIKLRKKRLISNSYFLVPKLRLGMPSRNAEQSKKRFDTQIFLKLVWEREK